jgi:hypothetical protein
MAWKIVAVLSVASYANLLFHWFTGGYEPTLLHYFFVIVALPVTVATVCYSFKFNVATIRFWQVIKIAFAIQFVAVVFEDIGPISTTLTNASSHPMAALLLGLAAIVGIQFLSLVGMSIQYAALSRYIKSQEPAQ